MAGDDSLAKFRKVYAAARAARDRPYQKDVNRTFGKIRRHAQGIVDLLADQNTRLGLTALLIEDGLTHEGAKQFIENLRLLASPPLSRLFATPPFVIPPPTPKARPGSIDDLREVFFVMLFKYHWSGPPYPTGDKFVEFCQEQLALAGDKLLERDVVQRILKGITRNRFFE